MKRALALTLLMTASRAFGFDLAHIHHFGERPLASQEARPGAFGIKLGVALSACGAVIGTKDEADSDEVATYIQVTPPTPDPLFEWYRVIVGPDGIVVGIGASTETRCDQKASLLTARYLSRWGKPALSQAELKAKQDANLNVAWIFPGLKTTGDPDARQGLFLMGQSDKAGCYFEYMLGDASLIAPPANAPHNDPPPP